MDRDAARDQAIERTKAKVAAAEDFLTGWPEREPQRPCRIHGTALFTLEAFSDPRLVLALGTGRTGALRVVWALWGADRNRERASSGAEEPVTIPATLSEPARRVLTLLAVDQAETEEAASAELADLAVAHEIGQFAVSIAHRTRDDHTAADFGAEIHAVVPGTGDVDVICVGTPI